MNVKFNGIGKKDSSELNFQVATGQQKTAKEIKQEKIEKQQAQGKTLKGYDLNLAKDPLQQKVDKARKEAMKKLTDVLNGHTDIADDLDKRASHIDELDKNILSDQKDLENLEKNKKALADEYAGKEDSKEYQEEMKHINDSIEDLQQRINKSKGEKDGESKTIEATHLALLKADPMVGAKKEADRIIEKANKEVISDVVNDAKDKIDEEMEEKIEKAQDDKEEKKEEEKKKVEKEKQQDELQERIDENHQDNKSPQEVAAENDDLDTANDVIQNADTVQTKIKDEVKNLLNIQKLVEDDIKGLQVDKLV